MDDERKAGDAGTELFDARGHLTPETLRLLRAGALGAQERLAAAEHLGACRTCAELFACALEEQGLERSPLRFEQEARARFARDDAGRRAARRRGGLLYRLQVLLAVCGALAFVFSGALRMAAADPGLARMKAPDLRFASAASSGLRSFSEDVVNGSFLRRFGAALHFGKD